MIIRIFSCSLILLFSGVNVYSQVIKPPSADIYQASSIPDSLKKDVHAVIRYRVSEIIVRAPGKAQVKRHSITTVLNEKGNSDAEMALFYDKKFNSINNAEMIVYDAVGKQIKKYKKSDMYDRSATDGISIITDDRVLIAGHDLTSYPATIEIITEEIKNSFLDLPDWDILEQGHSIQNEIMQISVNPETGFRYKAMNTGLQPIKSSSGIMEVYTWEINGMKAIRLEEDVPEWLISPRISFATNLFEFNGLPGDISSWKSFGYWLQSLNTDVGALSPQRESEIRQMTTGFATDKEKAKFLYEYMQKNVRYVSVQLGIGGLKPFPASFVDEKKYGDCKALSNYMRALLKAVNIPSYYSLVNAGENKEPADPAFSNDPFNHVILCIPFKNDTTWLECTSNTAPFGKLGPFTENRRALLVTDNGGLLVSTPKSTMDDNQFTSQVTIHLSESGSAKASLKIKANGAYRSIYLDLSTRKTDDQKEFLIRSLNLKTPSSIELKHTSDQDGIKEMDIELEYDKFCDVIAGDKQFYKPFVFDLWRVTFPSGHRLYPVYFDHPLIKSCLTTLILPAGYEAETVPANVNLKFEYGSFEISYAYDLAKNTMLITSRLRLLDHVIPASAYNKMQEYMDGIAKSQSKKLIIKRKA